MMMVSRNPLALMEEEKKEHSSRMQKMESEMEQVFEMKVKEKMAKLSELEADVSFFFFFSTIPLNLIIFVCSKNERSSFMYFGQEKWTARRLPSDVRNVSD